MAVLSTAGGRFASLRWFRDCSTAPVANVSMLISRDPICQSTKTSVKKAPAAGLAQLARIDRLDDGTRQKHHPGASQVRNNTTTGAEKRADDDPGVA